MIQNNDEYQIKYREYLDTLTLLRLVEARTPKQHTKIENMQNRINVLLLEMSEYKKEKQ